MFEHLESRYVDAGGIRTHYVEEGEGPVLLLIHGGGAGADGRSNYVDCLPKYAKDFRTIALDMVGFGLTERPSPEDFAYTQDTRTQHIIDFIEAMNIGPVYLIGNSMGGTTSMGVASKRPDLVKKLCLMGAAVNLTTDDMVALRPQLGPVMAYDDTKEGMRNIIKHLTYDYTPTEELVTYRYEMSLRPDAKAAYKSIMSWAGQNGLCYPDETFKALEMETLVICGRNDLMVPVDKCFEAMKLIPNCRGYVFSDCGHWCMIEYPDEFCQVTRDFFLR